ncbi:hypothetical protein MTsPCn3_05940 [Erythrobacter sp. MTPC3]
MNQMEWDEPEIEAGVPTDLNARITSGSHVRENTMNTIKNFVRDESGASAAEYALILAIVGAGIAGAALTLGNAISGSMSSAASTINS